MKIKCGAALCLHNASGICCQNEINIGAGRNMPTCESFTNDKDSYLISIIDRIQNPSLKAVMAGSVMSFSPNPAGTNVKCTQKECINNDGGICVKRNISVMPLKENQTSAICRDYIV